MSPKTGLLLVGHGTRSEVGSAQFLTLAKKIGQRAAGNLIVEPAFLELRQPDIDAAVARLAEQEIERLVTMPLLLFAAGHAKEDVPGAVAAALALRGRSDVRQVQAGHLGCHPSVVELSALRAEEVVSASQRGRASDNCGPRKSPGTENFSTCLLLVGRGSHDASATAEMYEFAGLRQQGFQGERVEVAFLAMARPLLSEQLALVARQDYRRVVVQPHLLFCGELVGSIERQVAEAKDRFPETEWITTRVLADLPGTRSRAMKLMEKVILDRCQEAGIHVVAAEADD